MVKNQTYPVDAPLITCHPRPSDAGNSSEETYFAFEINYGGKVLPAVHVRNCGNDGEWWRMMDTIHGYHGILTVHQSLAVMTPYDACVQWTPVGLLGVDQPSSLWGAIRFRLGRLQCICCRGLSVAVGVFHGEWEHAACILSWFMSTVVNPQDLPNTLDNLDCAGSWTAIFDDVCDL